MGYGCCFKVRNTNTSGLVSLDLSIYECSFVCLLLFFK